MLACVLALRPPREGAQTRALRALPQRCTRPPVFQRVSGVSASFAPGRTAPTLFSGGWPGDPFELLPARHSLFRHRTRHAHLRGLLRRKIPSGSEAISTAPGAEYPRAAPSDRTQVVPDRFEPIPGCPKLASNGGLQSQLVSSSSGLQIRRRDPVRRKQ